MKSFFYALCLITLSPGITLAQKVATGYVFNDDNGNSKKDSREKGIPNIAVSNGLAVVTTDKKGKYELPVGDDDIIFVIKPSGYKVPVNAYNQPQFYYIHKPNGSPAFKYKGVPATGPLPASIDFALVPHNEPDDFKALVFGDPQAADQRELGYFEKGIVSEVEGIKDVAFGITLGDLAQEDLTIHTPYINAIGKVGIPWYNVIGNHDLNMDAKENSLNDETFEANFGPSNYSYNYGKAHFIVLNNNLLPDPRDGKGIWGGFTERQFSFIENDLKLVDTSKLIVFAYHIPLYNQNEASFRKEDRVRFFQMLDKYPHILTLSAHTHNQRQDFYGKEWGWMKDKPFYEFNVGATCGNWYSGKVNEQGVIESVMSDGTPRGYVYLNISGNTYTADYKVAGKPADYRMGLYHRKVISTNWWDGRGFIYANFFMGYKDSKLSYRIDNGNWKPMRYSEEPDPAFVSELYKWDDADELFRGRRPTEPANCTHLWRAPLPGNLGVGQHQIEVRATDVFGRTFVHKSSYRIEEPKY